MGDVKRYTESCMEGGGVCLSRDGEFVSYKDYEKFRAEYKTIYRLLQSFENRFPDHVREVYEGEKNE